MKKTIFISALVAFLVTGLTFWGVQNLYQPKSNVVIEHVDNKQAKSALYTKDENGQFQIVDFTRIAKQVTDAVVHIRSTQTSRNPLAQRPEGNPKWFFEDDLFKRFFGPDYEGTPRNQDPGSPRVRMGSGSGVIINPQGYIVTNNHVIDGANDLEVTINDNRSFKASVIGTDPMTDIALIKIDEDNLPHLPLANSDDIQIGEWVMAVGNPFNLNSTVTAGIVSAVGRSINILSDRYAIESFIQTDAAINPGNSGGALVDITGALIGINTAIASPTGAYSGYGFAVPSNIVDKVVEDLLEYGNVQRGYLGALIRGVSSSLVKDKNLEVNTGVYIDSLTQGSAAGKAGIEAGDVIIEIDEIPIRTNSELLGYIARKRPGDQIRVKVDRFGKEKDYTVTLENREGGAKIAASEHTKLFRKLGAEFTELSKEEKENFGVNYGIKVVKLFPGKLTGQTLIREGFIVTKVNKSTIRSVKDLERVLENVSGGVMIEGFYTDPEEITYYGFGM